MKIFFLNFLSIFFKFFSLINLSVKSIFKKKYDRVYIISIDNLSFGGTGKTPLVIKIGKELAEQKIKFCIITRGYKSKFEKAGMKVSEKHSVKDVGDEAKIFKKYFPDNDIYIGKNRYKSIDYAINDGNKIIILDDGFQTAGLYKNMKIMLCNPNHNYYFLRNFKFLKRFEDYVFYYDDRKNKSVEQNKYSFEFEGLFNSNYERIYITTLKGDFLGFSALGDNDRFKNSISELNISLKKFVPFKDHYLFTNKNIIDLNNVRKNNNCDYLICSEKDFIKITETLKERVPLFFVANRIQLDLKLTEKIVRDAKGKNII